MSGPTRAAFVQACWGSMRETEWVCSLLSHTQEGVG